MAYRFSEIPENTPIVINIYNDDKQLHLDATLVKFLDKQLAIISINYPGDKVLNFDKVTLDIEYAKYQASPYVFRNCKIIYHSGNYILQVLCEGVKVNRRDSFRVPIGKTARSNIPGHNLVIVRDISHSGFALTDRNKNFNLSKGAHVSISFEDYGYKIDLEGTVVRIEEKEEFTIYGIRTTQFCRNLPEYIGIKQRPSKK